MEGGRSEARAVASFRALVPSMFHRRLILLMGSAVGVCVVLMAQAGNLTVRQGDKHLARAASRLVTERWTETVRGRILDRKGRVLAQDEASFDVLVDYRVITGEWAVMRAREAVLREQRDRWDMLDEVGRRALIERAIPEYQDRLERDWGRLAGALGIERGALEDARVEVVGRVHHMAAYVREQQRTAREQELNRDRRVAIPVTLRDVARPIAEERAAHVIVRGVESEVAADVRRLASGEDAMAGVVVRPSGRRVYPLETMEVVLDGRGMPSRLESKMEGAVSVRVAGVGTHVLGRMRGAQKEDFERRAGMDMQEEGPDRGRYIEGDRVGAGGIEEGAEDVLRGVRGRVVEHHDSGAAEVFVAGAGRDVRLTLDIALHARIQALMTPDVGLAKVQPWHATAQADQKFYDNMGRSLNGAAVVIEIESGEVLAMVSTPSFTRETYEEHSVEMARNEVDAPLVNKAVGKPYPPGSVVKPLVLTWAVTDNKLGLDEGIECTGALYPVRASDSLRCWIYKQFGRTHADDYGDALFGATAIEVSCNIFFYTLGRRLGFDGMVEWYKKMGVGEGYSLGIGGEYGGYAGRGEDTQTPIVTLATFMGIGQGPVNWTPLHAADAYATLARGGVRIWPRVVGGVMPRHSDLHWDSSAIEMAKRGLKGVINGAAGGGRWLIDPETGAREEIFNAPGVEVWGKTGTAAAPTIYARDAEGEWVYEEGRNPVTGEVENERIVLREGDHSWFVVLAGDEGYPKYAVSVIVEYGGSGGRVSGPIANQILHALVEEGYLVGQGGGG